MQASAASRAGPARRARAWMAALVQRRRVCARPARVGRRSTRSGRWLPEAPYTSVASGRCTRQRGRVRQGRPEIRSAALSDLDRADRRFENPSAARRAGVAPAPARRTRPAPAGSPVIVSARSAATRSSVNRSSVLVSGGAVGAEPSHHESAPLILNRSMSHHAAAELQVRLRAMHGAYARLGQQIGDRPSSTCVRCTARRRGTSRPRSAR